MIIGNTCSCTFCGKSQAEVSRLVAGPNVYICNECVELCSEIMNQNLDEGAEHKDEYTPREIVNFLNQYVVGQEKAKKVLAVAVFNHYNRLQKKNDDVEISKSNILLVGPTGSGKTLLAESVARLLNVPFAIADATSLTQAGYVGDDVESIFTKLIANANGDVSKAERGIVFIDEIDKLAKMGAGASLSRDVSGEGVQQALLKILEGSDVSIPQNGGRKHPGTEMNFINTRNILFICGGAFSGIEKLIEKAGQNTSIGFVKAKATKEDEEIKNYTETMNKRITPDILVKYGMTPEFIGRLPVICNLEDLTEEDLVRVLSEPKNSIAKQYVAVFKNAGVELVFTDNALKQIARVAIKQKTGARGLRSIVENLMLDTMFVLPEIAGRKIVVDDIFTYKTPQVEAPKVLKQIQERKNVKTTSEALRG